MAGIKLEIIDVDSDGEETTFEMVSVSFKFGGHSDGTLDEIADGIETVLSEVLAIDGETRTEIEVTYD